MIKKYYLILLFFICGCSKESVNWHQSNLEDALAISKDKIIMLDFYTDW
tara:strand:- start:4618 stop:4764 length:147 start_codon:yes stop_codon:yes gene_type:complete